MTMTAVGRNGGPLSHFWEWLGWRSPGISAHRTAARTVRREAESKLYATRQRVQESREMSDWLKDRYVKNHIAEALGSVLDHPRTSRSSDG